MTNPLDLSAEDFGKLDAKAMCEGLMDGCDGFRMSLPHADPNCQYSCGSKEAKSYYIGYVKMLSTLDDLIHDRKGREADLGHEDAAEEGGTEDGPATDSDPQ